MSFAENPSPSAWGNVAAVAAADERADFIRRTYLHLVGAVFAFIGLEVILLNLPSTPQIIETMIGGRYSMLIVMGAFIGVSYLANMWAMSATSRSTQYLGLGLYVVAEALIFLPMLYIADNAFPGKNLIPLAGMATMVIFGGLTFIAFTTAKDFSFLGGALRMVGIGAFALILASYFFGFNLGTFFSVAMITFAGAYILYDTSNILHHYRTDQHVAAALALFASVALLFWYVLRLLMQLQRR